MTVAALRWFKAALVLQILLVGYWLTMAAVPVVPWNDLKAAPIDAAAIRNLALILLPLLAFSLCFATGIQLVAAIAVVGYGVYLVWNLWIWWKPFALGASPAWQAHYEAVYANTLKVLPAFGKHIPPDAQTLTLQILLAATLFVTTMAVARMKHL